MTPTLNSELFSARRFSYTLLDKKIYPMIFKKQLEYTEEPCEFLVGGAYTFDSLSMPKTAKIMSIYEINLDICCPYNHYRCNVWTNSSIRYLGGGSYIPIIPSIKEYMMIGDYRVVFYKNNIAVSDINDPFRIPFFASKTSVKDWPITDSIKFTKKLNRLLLLK